MCRPILINIEELSHSVFGGYKNSGSDIKNYVKSERVRKAENTKKSIVKWSKERREELRMWTRRRSG